jgi:hypothetical protein
VSILAVSIVITGPNYYLITTKKYFQAGHILVLVPSALATILMWRFGGIADEVVLAFPAILAFAILFGHRHFFFVLLIFAILNFLMIGYLNDIGIMKNDVPSNSLENAILISMLCLMSVFSTYIIAKDLKNTLVLPRKENQENIKN